MEAGEMRLKSFWQKLSSGGKLDAELKAARAKHGIAPDDTEDTFKPEEAKYDPWDEVRNMRSSFFFGSWVSRKKIGIVGTDKLKAKLAELEKEREEKAGRGES
jgi:hypothetical protein